MITTTTQKIAIQRIQAKLEGFGMQKDTSEGAAGADLVMEGETEDQKVRVVANGEPPAGSSMAITWAVLMLAKKPSQETWVAHFTNGTPVGVVLELVRQQMGVPPESRQLRDLRVLLRDLHDIGIDPSSVDDGGDERVNVRPLGATWEQSVELVIEAVDSVSESWVWFRDENNVAHGMMIIPSLDGAEIVADYTNGRGTYAQEFKARIESWCDAIEALRD